MRASDGDPRPLIAHIVYSFDTGGLENGIVNLINRLSPDRWRHAIIALTSITEFRRRIARDDVEFFALDKRPGHGATLFPRMTRLLRQLRPAIVHTRNLAALEMTVPAWLAGVPTRIHGEHGRDVNDLDGSSRKYQWARRMYRPFVTRYVALSGDLNRYLVERVGVPQACVEEICNGVDSERFHPAAEREPIAGCPFTDPSLWLVGTVGRMQAVKDQANLARAFVRAIEIEPAIASRLRLVLVGDGPLLDDCRMVLDAAGLSSLAWLPGERRDVDAVLRGLDCFVLPSLAEGISNTILEAMASGLPVVATDVGGNPELIEDGVTGRLVPSADPDALAKVMLAYATDQDAARHAGRAGRERIERLYSLQGMVARYDALYARYARPGFAAEAAPTTAGAAIDLVGAAAAAKGPAQGRPPFAPPGTPTEARVVGAASAANRTSANRPAANKT